jgi:hypothetical protein
MEALASMPEEGSTSSSLKQVGIALPWDEPGWFDDVTAWISTHVEHAGSIKRKHARAWSLIARVPTAAGVNPWFKEVGPPLAHEPPLTEALARHVPSYVPGVIAAEGSRLLTHHVGKRLDRVIGAAGAAAPVWERVVARYAELQIELIPLAAELPAPDGRPETIVQRFGERVAPVVAALGDAIPLTLVHLSVSHKNVCMRNGSPVFIDWAAGAIAHPFCGLAKTLRLLVRHFGAEPGGRELRRIRDAYLEPWTTFAAPQELRRIFQTAYALGALCRAAAKERVLDSLSASTREIYADGMAAQLIAFENAMHDPHTLGA